MNAANVAEFMLHSVTEAAFDVQWTPTLSPVSNMRPVIPNLKRQFCQEYLQGAQTNGFEIYGGIQATLTSKRRQCLYEN